jgi:putative transposase
MIERDNKKLSISKQAKLLSLNRTSLYYKPVPVNDEELQIKRLIDEIYTKHPEYGYRRMTTILNRDYGVVIKCRFSRSTLPNYVKNNHNKIDN